MAKVRPVYMEEDAKLSTWMGKTTLGKKLRELEDPEGTKKKNKKKKKGKRIK